MPNSTYTFRHDLEGAHIKKVNEYIPAIAAMITASTFGIVGNVLTAVFYGFKAKKTSTTTLITALSVVDFAGSGLFYLFVSELLHVYYIDKLTCKISYFLVHVAVFTSVILLGLISVDRYRKVCKPAAKQLTVTTAKSALTFIAALVLGLSLSDFATYDAVAVSLITKTNETVIGYYCTNTDDPDVNIYVALFHYVDITICVAVLITFILTYGSIWKVMKQHRVNFSLYYSRFANGSYTITKSIQNGRRSVRMNESETAITVMLFVVSVGLLLCFVPYYYVVIMKMTSRDREFEHDVVFQFLFRTAPINCVINPIIFFIFNPQFRRYVNGLLFCFKSSKT